MRSPYVVCPSCARHVRVAEECCPFCARSLPVGLVPTPHGPSRRYIGKNATALALTAALAGCGGQVEVETPLPATDAGVDTAPTDTGREFSLPDSAADTFASDVRDEGGAMPVYK